MKSFLVLFFLSLSLAVSAQSQETISGNGKIKKEKRNASGSFDEIQVSGRYKVLFRQGSTTSIEVEADENLLPYIETNVDGAELQVHSKKGYNVKPTATIVVYITLPKLSSLQSSGSSSFSGEGSLKGDKLEISLSGKADVDLSLNYSGLELAVSGSGMVKLAGSVTKVEVNISGSGEFVAPDMKSQNMEINISGNGNAHVNVEKKLEIAISGNGKVKYKGSAITEQAVAGNGRVEHEN
ncbi:hypothetical protein GFS24_10745 [Chitinophaga sp. SYP-B3965]|uniref:head GIN domain-containing protein n=1 Tax=Chitinophaga sp. SYP-B3965 TaxID=2663120 RepID=UPI00129976C9|nr:head GIN domain-containing protein [Chitinophaga sp. SYP-B3965]MRG45596.1 hypothetical protein [Chitinophaga sp. SYP-B3965]